MTFLAPFWMMIAGVAVVGIAALHLITTRRPPPAPLPTARFVPDADASTTARAARPTDLWLLAVRTLALLALGAAVAGLELASGGSTVRRVIVADRSRAATAAVRDSARYLLRPGDALVLVDSAARWFGRDAVDSLRAFSTVGARGELSAGLAAARRAATMVASPADSVELVVVSPFAADEFDAATLSFAVAWPGRVRVVRTARAVPRPQPVELRAVATSADSALARRGAAIVVWPSLASAGQGVAPAAPDPAAVAHPAGVATVDAVLVAPLSVAPLDIAPLSAAAPSAATIDGGMVVVARWANGDPAAVERRTGDGCLRSVGIGVPTAGDVMLQPAFRALARTLLGPCAARTAGAWASDSMARMLTRNGAAAPATRLRDREAVPALTPWLLLAALLLLIGELALRRATVERRS